jgi:hypothetical protein
VDAAALASAAARLVLAGVLAVAAFRKLRAPDVTRATTLTLLGERAGPVVARVLPFVELVVALALVVWWTPVPGVVAFVLLVGFTVVLVRAQTRQLPCPCFGGSRDTPVTGASILRNGLLAALAVLATGSPAGAFDDDDGSAATRVSSRSVVVVAAQPPQQELPDMESG